MRTIVLILLLLINGPAVSETLPEMLKRSPEINLPVSMGKSSWRRQSYDANNPSGDSIEKLNEFADQVAAMSGLGIFGAGGKLWAERYFNEIKRYWGMASLPCQGPVECYVFSTTGFDFLVVIKDSRLMDAQLIRGFSSIVEKEGRDRRYVLDSTFGDGVIWQPLPITNFEETGIFCSYIEEKVSHMFASYKRRITRGGRIENKQLGESEECKAPW